eukprot:CAMPEP_0172009468 /NCGR_PEP_ID=MMETSP1041-20130122/7201_1 /TAXON_ID=464988 /ORGANISM="Hemiselmis andersenii, Strain CCMP439" /LENGTH=129 /DNA_ID=CAMNT_0012663741 /DNA_START=403 /DNA_END=792 /DNA_ORIENTATION=+
MIAFCSTSDTPLATNDFFQSSCCFGGSESSWNRLDHAPWNAAGPAKDSRGTDAAGVPPLDHPLAAWPRVDQIQRAEHATGAALLRPSAAVVAAVATSRGQLSQVIPPADANVGGREGSGESARAITAPN